MNLNVLAYCVYLGITAYIIAVVGRVCYRNGNVFVSALVPGHEELCHRINRMLLLGYYLINLGYAAVMIAFWEQIPSYERLVEAVAARTSVIVGILCVLHYCNIFLIAKYVHKLTP